MCHLTESFVREFEDYVSDSSCTICPKSKSQKGCKTRTYTYPADVQTFNIKCYSVS